MSPRVSVLLPVRGGAATLEDCLRSLLRQTWSDWECALVDDGSTDGTRAMAEAAARRDRRIRVLPGTGAGLVNALNHGLAECTGEFVARMDADDLMHRQRLARQVEALQGAPQLTAVGCRVRAFPGARIGPGLQAYLDWLNAIATPEDVRREAFVECPIAHPTLMVRRQVLAAVGYRGPGWPEDYDLVLRLLARGSELSVVPRRLLAWRRSPHSWSATGPDYAIERFTACKAAFLAEGFLKSGPDFVLWGYGRTGRTLARALRRHGKRPAFVVELHPGRLGNRIHGAPVVPPSAIPELPALPLLVSVAGRENRQRIRAELGRLHRLELRDFLCVA